MACKKIVGAQGDYFAKLLFVCVCVCLCVFVCVMGDFDECGAVAIRHKQWKPNMTNPASTNLLGMDSNMCVNEMLFISLFQLSNHLKCTHSLLIILYLISFWYIKKIFF
jgi:hypothetical protein